MAAGRKEEEKKKQKYKRNIKGHKYKRQSFSL